MKTTLILHGHFYQPPRDMPNTGLIPKQPSAFPHGDWNERITRECYAANAFSRYLTYDGRVISIVNNYEYLSFNFGPTLLHWLQSEDPKTYARIIEADRISAERNHGHGNAIAQSFNHTILPLDTPEDALTQIMWGLEDFSHHFGRAAEGIWLPEAAVNTHIVDILIDLGIKFIVLSPWQAERIEKSPGTWYDLKDEHAPYQEPYRIEGTSGSLAAFFYHPGLASGISFDHYLRDADLLFERLQEVQRSDAPALLHSATDGEIFGHHEPYGDMCLAALMHKIRDDEAFTVSNYGAYLAEHPPTLRAQLRSGEGNKGSSWSCFHGVSRWYKDCGCSTGGKEGWNQQWRTPLRNAFRALSNELVRIYTRELGRLLPGSDPKNILQEYAQVVSGRSTPIDFAQRLLGARASAHTISTLLRLLEGQRFRMYTFTSCGWFFADISGLEPIQNMRYAIQAVNLYQQFSDKDLMYLLLQSLKGAKSNISGIGTGAEILVSLEPTHEHGYEAIAFFVLNHLIACPEKHRQHYGMFDLLEIDLPDQENISITIFDKPLHRELHYRVSYIYDEEAGIMLSITLLSTDEVQTPTPIQVADLPERMIDELYSWIDNSLARVADNDIERVTQDISNYTALIKQGACEPNDSFYITNMGTCLRTLHSLFRQDLPFTAAGSLSLMDNLLRFIQLKADKKIKLSTEQSLSLYVKKHAQHLRDEFSRESSQFICSILSTARAAGFTVDITELQNYVFTHIDRVRAAGEPCSPELIQIGLETGIVVDDLTAG